MKIVFVASLIRNSLCIIYVFFCCFFKNHFLPKNILIAAINLATQGPLYTCLVLYKVQVQWLQMRQIVILEKILFQRERGKSPFWAAL